VITFRTLLQNIVDFIIPLTSNQNLIKMITQKYFMRHGVLNENVFINLRFVKFFIQ